MFECEILIPDLLQLSFQIFGPVQMSIVIIIGCVVLELDPLGNLYPLIFANRNR